MLATESFCLLNKYYHIMRYSFFLSTRPTFAFANLYAILGLKSIMKLFKKTVEVFPALTSIGITSPFF